MPNHFPRLTAILRRFRAPSAALAGTALIAAPAIAAFPQKPLLPQETVETDDMVLAQRAAAANDPAEALARFLRVLAHEPRDLDALMGAGKASLDIGDANAAVSFYARAEEIEPHNGRIKAGLGSAMVQLMQPRPALRFFEEAVQYGVPAVEIAADRGMAYALRGDSKHARADYELALASQPSDETTRRLAVTQAIDGDVPGAMATLDKLLRRQDKAAWRDRVFLLALGGDLAGAQRTANAMLPREQAAALQPFLDRLPKLRASQQAAAILLGQFPADGRQYSESELAAAAGSPPPLPPVQKSTIVSRRNDAGDEEGDGVPDEDRAQRPIPAKRSKGKLETASPNIVSNDGENAVLTASRPDVLALVAPSSPPSAKPAASPQPAPPRNPALGEAGLANWRLGATPTVPTTTASSKAPETKKPIAAREEQSAQTGESKAKSGKTVAADKAEDKSKGNGKRIDVDTARESKNDKDKDKRKKDLKAKDETKKATAAKKEPQRYWVQVATGAYKPDLGKEWARLKAKYPAMLGKRTPWATPLNHTNRLLIGPFKSDEEAQSFVNKAAGSGFGTSPFTSSPGQSVQPIGQ